MILEKYSCDAWSRRVAKDFSFMPKSMQIAFYINHYIQKARSYLAFPLLLGAIVMMLCTIDGTYLMGGYGLISDSAALESLAWLSSGAILTRWIMPSLSSLVFSLWYTSARRSFNT